MLRIYKTALADEKIERVGAVGPSFGGILVALHCGIRRLGIARGLGDRQELRPDFIRRVAVAWNAQARRLDIGGDRRLLVPGHGREIPLVHEKLLPGRGLQLRIRKHLVQPCVGFARLVELDGGFKVVVPEGDGRVAVEYL